MGLDKSASRTLCVDDKQAVKKGVLINYPRFVTESYNGSAARLLASS